MQPPTDTVSREQIMTCIRLTAAPAYYEVRWAELHQARFVVQLGLVGYTNGWIDGRIERWMDGWMGGWSVQMQFN